MKREQKHVYIEHSGGKSTAVTIKSYEDNSTIGKFRDYEKASAYAKVHGLIIHAKVMEEMLNRPWRRSR